MNSSLKLENGDAENPQNFVPPQVERHLLCPLLTCSAILNTAPSFYSRFLPASI